MGSGMHDIKFQSCSTYFSKEIIKQWQVINQLQKSNSYEINQQLDGQCFNNAIDPIIIQYPGPGIDKIIVFNIHISNTWASDI